jgi:mRNA-degrading endonuclease toxin of MazEF toxin-antitoxin module
MKEDEAMADEPAEYRKGDVVLVAFSSKTSDGITETKQRSAVIVSSDEQFASLDDVLLIPVLLPETPGLESRRVLIAATSPEGIAAGLEVDSAIDCTVITTIPKNNLIKKTGKLSDETMKQVETCLRRSIEPNNDDDLAGMPRKPLPKDSDSGNSTSIP